MQNLKQKFSILCVDESALVGHLLIQLFQAADFYAELVSTVHQAWEKLVRLGKRFDAVVIDHPLPEMIGVSLVAALRIQNFVGKIVVYSTTLARNEAVMYRALKVDALLAKTPDTSALLHSIKKLASKRPAQKKSRIETTFIAMSAPHLLV